MTLIRQVVRDLVKDVGWVVFYGFLTAMSIIAFVLVGLSYCSISSCHSFRKGSLAYYGRGGCAVIRWDLH